MSVVTRTRRKEEAGPLERLAEIDLRIQTAKAESNQLGREQQIATEGVRQADAALIEAEGRHGAGHLSDEQLDQERKTYEAAKLEGDRPWKRLIGVAGAKLNALQLERNSFLAQHSAELAAAVTQTAESVRDRIIRNCEQRGELAAEMRELQIAWRNIGYAGARFPLDNLAQEWRKGAQEFDPASIPLITPRD